MKFKTIPNNHYYKSRFVEMYQMYLLVVLTLNMRLLVALSHKKTQPDGLCFFMVQKCVRT